MFHTVAFSQALTTANAGTLVTPIVDNTVTINGNNLLVPDRINQIFAVAPFATTGAVATNVQVQTPSLRENYFPNVQPIVIGTTFSGLPHVFEQFDNPIPLETNEGLNIQSDATSAATAGQQGAIVFLSDGARTPIKSSRIFTMRCTAAVALAANTWVNGPLTFSQTLPVGNYDVVGMRAEGTGLLASRLVFVGMSATTRPGTPGVSGSGQMDLAEFRQGRLGVWGTFNSLTPPSIDALGATGTAQVIYLDLVPK